MNALIRKIIYIAMPVLLLSGCSAASSSGIHVWIDVPVDGIHVPEGTVLPIEGHASSAGGISQVEIWINGSMQYTLNNLSAIEELYAFSQTWTPPAAGEYTIQVVAMGGNGSTSDTDSVRVQVGEMDGITETPIPVITETFTPTPFMTNTITPTPTVAASDIQFYAYPAEIAAGACTTLYWNVENAQQVIFGGVDQPFSGSYETCLCAGAVYPLTVVNLDGTEERYTVEVSVTGVCATETPPPPPPVDTTPPPVPSPSVPEDGLALSCRSTQTLAWLPVDDFSGISGYYVKLEIETSPGTWQTVKSYGPLAGKQVNVNVQCGGHYRWMVRSQDGAGNYSSWSAFSEFGIDLN